MMATGSDIVSPLGKGSDFMSSGAGFEPRKKACNVHFTFNAVLDTMMHRRKNSTAAEVHVGVILQCEPKKL